MPRLRRPTNTAAWASRAAFIATFVVCGPAFAQPGRPYPPTYPPPPYPQPLPVANGPSVPPVKSLKARIGLDAARGLLTSDDPKARVRGVERLGVLSDPQAIDTLLDALDTGTILSRDLDARLAAVRVLADHAGRPDVRTYLARELMAAAAASRTTTSTGAVVRGTAAIALAQQGDEKCLSALLVAMELRGPTSDAARTALLAYPPRTLDPFLFVPDDDSASNDDVGKNDDKGEGDGFFGATHTRPPNEKKDAKPEPDSDDKHAEPSKKRGKKPRTLSPAVIDLLGDLGDLRALAALRTTERSAQAQALSRAHAALALARMGDSSGAIDARRWARSNDDKLVEVAARTLVLLDDWSEDVPASPTDGKAPKTEPTDKTDPSKSIKTPAVRGVARLLGIAASRRAAMDLIADSRSPERFRPVLDQLDTIAHETSGDDRSAALLTMARVGGATKLTKWLDNKDLGHVAAWALATLPGDEATEALGAALHARLATRAASPPLRRLVRAGVIRFAVLGVKTQGLDEAVAALSKSKDDADVEASAFARVALGASVGDVIGDVSSPHAKPVNASVVAGAARAALLSGPGSLRELAPLLHDADDGQEPSLTHVAAGVALMLPEGRNAVPQKTLLAWVEGGGALAPLAAYALPSRDDDAVHPRIKELLLEGTDPVIRAHLALGLSEDPDPSAVSLLVEAYTTDASPLVRRAAVRALSRRTEPQRERALHLAQSLDPDDYVRSLAARALRGRIEDTPLPLGLSISWTKIEETKPPARPVAGRYLREDGFALPFVSPADGDLLEPAPSFGQASISVYPGKP